MSLGLIICGDCDLLSSCQLDGLTIFQESCTDFRALQKNATSFESLHGSAATAACVMCHGSFHCIADTMGSWYEAVKGCSICMRKLQVPWCPA